MLIKATLEDVARYGEFVYGLSLEPARSGYPAYWDGIKTREDFIAAAEKAVSGKKEELLLFVMDGVVEGWIGYYWIPEDQYLQLSSCNIRRGTEQALTELLETLEERFGGYTAYFGYPGENLDAIRFLQAHGFRQIEEDWNHSFFFDGYKPLDCDRNVERISCDNFSKFRAVYREDPETYWSCDRILETLDDWTIFVYNKANTPVAAVFFQGAQGYFEIYGMEFAEEEFPGEGLTGGAYQERVYRALLTASLNECSRRNARFMTYFCGEQEKPVLKELGFRCVGLYVLYIICLRKR